MIDSYLCRMPMGWIASVLIGLLVLVTEGCASSGGGKEPRVEGDTLEFSLPDLQGRTVTTSDGNLQGKVVLVTLWGTWCPPCVSEIPTFNDLQGRFGDQGLVIAAIAFEKENDPAARRNHLDKFVSEHGIDYLVLDGGSTGDFSTTLPMVDQVKGLPVEILLGRDGRVVDARHGYGHSEKWATELESRLKVLLRE